MEGGGGVGGDGVWGEGWVEGFVGVHCCVAIGGGQMR